MEKVKSVPEAIESILNEKLAGNQAELKFCLAKMGFEVTQSTVSRALKKLGAVRTYDEDNQAFYALPPKDAPPSLDSSVLDLVLNLEHNENSIVVNTKPGSASLIARHIDFNSDSVIGTIAGDDCILVIPRSIKDLQGTIKELKNLLGVS